MIFGGLIKNQRGFTLIEIILAIAITGIIVGGITMTIFQVFSVNTRSSNHMVAVREVQNAGYWISRDAQMAQEEPDISDDEFLTLTWTDWDSGDEHQHQVVYSLEDDCRLKREHYFKLLGAEEFKLDTTTFVAQFIESCEFTKDDHSLIVTVTARVGEESETRIYQAMPRPKMEEK